MYSDERAQARLSFFRAMVDTYGTTVASRYDLEPLCAKWLDDPQLAECVAEIARQENWTFELLSGGEVRFSAKARR